MSGHAAEVTAEISDSVIANSVADAQAARSSAWKRVRRALARMEKGERRVLLGTLAASVSLLAIMLIGLQLAIQNYVIRGL